MLPPDAATFVRTMYHAHIDNAKRIYTGKIAGQINNKTISPLTNFIFEYFIFNSLYAIDWQATARGQSIAHHERLSRNESDQQRAFVDFCFFLISEKQLNLVTRAFSPLGSIDHCDLSWTEVTPDINIRSHDGRNFFENIFKIVALAKEPNCTNLMEFKERIHYCLRFIYKVRNNVFHGTKSLGDAVAPSQARRISVYDMFLRCINSLFFLLVENNECGADFSQIPIGVTIGNKKLEFDVTSVAELLNLGFLRPEDSRLIYRLQHDEFQPIGNGIRQGALVCSSSGHDVMLPLLIAYVTSRELVFLQHGTNSFAGFARACNQIDAEISPPIHGEHGTNYLISWHGITMKVLFNSCSINEFMQSSPNINFLFHRQSFSQAPGIAAHRVRDILSELLPSGLLRDGAKWLLRESREMQDDGVAELLQSYESQVLHVGARYVYRYGIFRTQS